MYWLMNSLTNDMQAAAAAAAWESLAHAQLAKQQAKCSKKTHCLVILMLPYLSYKQDNINIL